jgi:hypothetical protein
MPPRREHSVRGQALVEMKTPWPIFIAVRLIPLVGERRAWSMPLPLALAYSTALCELAGDDSWMSEDEATCPYVEVKSEK